MARRRYRQRSFRRKGRWSANIRTIQKQTLSTSPDSSFYYYETLCTNPAQENTTVSQQFTVKNIELSYELESRSTTNLIENLIVYVMFIPQGYTVTETLPNTHPEWIMAYRFLGSPDYESQATNVLTTRMPPKIRSRLARRLQTGDQVIFLITGINTSTTTTEQLDFCGVVRWWSKAN